jgi:SNF2 family DNA or RNA helicase
LHVLGHTTHDPTALERTKTYDPQRGGNDNTSFVGHGEFEEEGSDEDDFNSSISDVEDAKSTNHSDTSHLEVEEPPLLLVESDNEDGVALGGTHRDNRSADASLPVSSSEKGGTSLPVSSSEKGGTSLPVSSSEKGGKAPLVSRCDAPFEVSEKLWERCFPHQREGVMWLWGLHKRGSWDDGKQTTGKQKHPLATTGVNDLTGVKDRLDILRGGGGILGDDMGLGKTFQVRVRVRVRVRG